MECWRVAYSLGGVVLYATDLTQGTFYSKMSIMSHYKTLQFITDDKGNRLAAVVPIAHWEPLADQYSTNVKAAQSSSVFEVESERAEYDNIDTEEVGKSQLEQETLQSLTEVKSYLRGDVKLQSARSFLSEL